MALTHWKNFNDFFADPWRSYHNLLPYWRIRPWNDDFGFGIFPSEFSREFRDMERQAQEMERKFRREFFDFVPSTGFDGFQIQVDVQQFSPNEITVKMNENTVLVEAKHEERQDECGFIARLQLTRRYTLPPGYDPNTITSELSSNGILTIKATLPQALENSNVRIIPIQQTGPARLKENKAVEK